MNGRITPLPHWVLTDYQSAFYDSESGSVLQALARIYPKIEELITDYNNYVKQIDNIINDFQTGMIEDFECFKQCIIETMNNYIETIDTKINLQDTKIDDAINYMKNNIVSVTTEIFNQAIQNGDIMANLNVDYNSTTEELTFSIIAEGGE